MKLRQLRDYFWATGEPWNGIRIWLVPRLMRVAHSLLMTTLRFSASGVGRAWQYENQAALFVIWHDLTFVTLHFFRDKNVGAMMSTSRAGRMQAAFWNLYGWPIVWGSTNKRAGVRALREVMNGLRAGRWFAFTPDGPKGPRHRANAGAIYLASNAPAVVIPIAVSASSAWRLPTWDKYLIPRPFSRVHIHMGEPTFLPGKLSKEEMAQWQTRVEEMLSEAQREADARLSSTRSSDKGKTIR